MKTLILKYAEFAKNIFPRKLSFFRISMASIAACFFSFCLVFGGIYITASRNMAIKQIRFHMAQTISWLNELGLDIAYDNIEFNSLLFSPLVTIDNLQIYNTKGLNTWVLKFKQIKAYPNIFGTPRIRFSSNDGGKFIFNDFISDMTSGDTFLDITSNHGNIGSIMLHSEDINIHDFAKIERITYLLESVSAPTINNSANIPSFESFFEMNNVELNGLLNYPLSSHLTLLYAKANIMGRILPDDSLLTSMESWLKDGGFIDVPNLIVQWEPLTLVGRGSINFNEQLSPKVNLNTSSKGILRLLQDLQENNFLENKNVFVANILLSNKAYKLNPEDKEMTISAPISYSDGKIAIENLTIKDFNK